jgi:riboflavin kinase/FMN adenylyltransferase
VESFIMGFDENIYGETVQLSFVKRIRNEIKFSSVPNLVAQIRDDVRDAEAILQRVRIDKAATSSLA